MRRRATTLALVALALVACRPEGKPQPFRALGTDGEALRAAFNADIGKVRAVMLVAPT